MFTKVLPSRAKMEDMKMDQVRTYRGYCAELEAIIDKVAENGDLMAAALCQAALDELRTAVVRIAANNGS